MLPSFQTTLRRTRVMMIPLMAMLALSSALLSSCKTLGLGTPEYCEPKVKPYVEKTWAPYCEKLNEHLEDPTAYKLLELTKFLSEYPLKAEEIRNEMSRYKEIKKCYADGADQLKYNRLKACAADDDDMAYRASSSWKVAAEKWFEDTYTFQTKKLNRELKTLTKRSARVNRELEERFGNKVDFDMPLYNGFHEGLETERERFSKVEAYEALYKKALSTAGGYKALQSSITNEFGSKADTLARLQEENRQLLKALNVDDRYFGMAVYATGRKCPSSSGNRGRRNIAKRLLREPANEIQASSQIILKSGLDEREDGPAMFQSFQGKLCGNRKPKNQFDKRRTLCTMYTFTIERSKGVDDRRWDEWTLRKFEEDGPKGSVDCKLL